MVLNETTGDSAARTASQFATTHWSVVLAAGDSASPGSREALEKLCQTYWYPLYAFVRRKGYPPEDAKDLHAGLLRAVPGEALRQGLSLRRKAASGPSC